MKKSSKSRLMPRHEAAFPDDTLFHKIARTVCRAGTLPRKELYEAWETARRVRRRFRGGRIVDLACGHGLLAQILMILDRKSPGALAVDRRIPANAGHLARTMAQEWPHLERDVEFVEADIESIELGPDDLVVSAHACGALTDVILERATAARARVAVLPCCHDARHCDTGPLAAWMTPGLAIDAVRALKLESLGYEVTTALIPLEITPKNRLILGTPLPGKENAHD